MNETKGINYKNLKSQCVTPGQEHLSELAIMPDPLNTFDVMGWLKRWQCSLSTSYCTIEYKSIPHILFLNTVRVNLKRLACGIIDSWIKNMKKSLRIWE